MGNLLTAGEPTRAYFLVGVGSQLGDNLERLRGRILCSELGISLASGDESPQSQVGQ
jgi:hypothetical protein